MLVSYASQCWEKIEEFENQFKENKKKILDDITEYFENEWLTVLDSWYEGYNGAFTPSTNNQLEATNKVIKDERTFRERHTLSRFLTVASDIVNK